MNAHAAAPPRYAVIGNPIAHSRSPLLHRRFAEQTGVTLDYSAIEAGAQDFVRAAESFRAHGGQGLNVTTPFKLDAFAYATTRSASATAAGAANALKFDGDQVLAENFDGLGLVRDISRNVGIRLRGRRVLLLGAGGAARGAVLPLLKSAPAMLSVWNRDAARAAELVRRFVADGPLGVLAQADTAVDSHDVIINATSASLHGEAPPLPARFLRGAQLAYDMSYGRGLTPFLAMARTAGITHLADGVGMLAEQAAESFHWWHGIRPDTRDVIRELATPLA